MAGRLGWYVCVVVAVVAGGCGGRHSREAKLARSPLAQSKFAAAILLPETLRLKEHVAGPAAAWGGMSGTEANLWIFKTESAPEELVAYFKKELPLGKLGRHPIENAVPEIVWRPKEAATDEEVVVTIRKGEVQIRESLRKETAAAWRER